jgi:hypothetical protein
MIIMKKFKNFTVEKLLSYVDIVLTVWKSLKENVVQQMQKSRFYEPPYEDMRNTVKKDKNKLI